MLPSGSAPSVRRGLGTLQRSRPDAPRPLGRRVLHARHPCVSTPAAATDAALAGRAIAQRILRERPNNETSTPEQPPGIADLGVAKDIATHYELRHDERLGVGAFGKVYIAMDRNSGAHVAVKTLPKTRGKLTRTQTLSKIMREIRIHEEVQGGARGCVGLLGVYEDANNVHMVQELCMGGDLKTRVEKHGPLSEAQLRHVAVEVIASLRSFHDVGVLYADCKPANLCLVTPDALDSDGHQRGPALRIVDFGCSQSMTPGVPCINKRTGTLAYMAPEVFSKNMVPQSDVWSLAVTLHFLFAGRLPFWAPNEAPRLTRIEEMAEIVRTMPIRFDYAPWSNMTPEGIDFMQRCLTRDPLTRMSLEEAEAHPWLAYQH